MKPTPWRPLALLAALLWLAACGYHISGTGDAPAGIRSIAIPVFTNTSSEPEIHRDLTRALQRAFVSDGRLNVVRRERADLVMQGELNHYSQKAASFDSSDVVLEYWVEVGVNVEVIDRASGKPYIKKESHRVKWDYRTTPDLIVTEASRKFALEKAYGELGNRLVSLVLERF